MSNTSKHFPTDVTGLDTATGSEVIEVCDGGEVDLRIAPVVKQVGEDTVRMLAYNGSVPGPTLKVRQGSEIVVNVENQGDLEATVHWFSTFTTISEPCRTFSVGPGTEPL